MQSSLRDMLRQRKDSILDHWFQGMLGSYAEDTASFLRKQSDRFTNPVAYALKTAMESICQALIDDRDVDRAALDYAMKVRAVQENDPAKGIAFIHLLKETIRQMLSGYLTKGELADLDSRVDKIALIASDMFAINRAKIAELRARYNLRPGRSFTST